MLLDTADSDGSWSTIGVSENIIEASWQALVDAIVFGLVRAAEGGADEAEKGREETEPEHRADLASVEAVP